MPDYRKNYQKQTTAKDLDHLFKIADHYKISISHVLNSRKLLSLVDSYSTFLLNYQTTLILRVIGYQTFLSQH